MIEYGIKQLTINIQDKNISCEISKIYTMEDDEKIETSKSLLVKEDEYNILYDTIVIFEDQKIKLGDLILKLTVDQLDTKIMNFSNKLNNLQGV